MNLNELTLGQIKELQCLFTSKQDSICCEENLGTQIVILQRGWVFVGNMTKKGSACKLVNAQTIRVWGTSKGLGEIAESGPTSSTKLDPCPEVTFHELTIIATIKCDEKAWQKHLK